MDRIIAVGSTNPVKVKATTLAAKTYWDDVSIVSINTNSGISDMPLSKVEARLGAQNRAEEARNIAEAWLGVGNEGGTCWVRGKLYLFSTTYVTDGDTYSFGGETLMRLPTHVVQAFGDGSVELGTVLDQLLGTDNIKQKEGAVGYLSKNAITRTDIFRNSVMMAFSHWLEK